MKKIKEYYFEVESNKITDKRIVLLSDIHYYDKKEYFKLEAISEYLFKLKPDYILIAGDLLDEAFVYDLNKLYEWFKKVSKIASIYISLGNHDLLIEENFKTGFDKEFFKRLEKISNVKVLDNTLFVDDNICFRGLTMPAEYFYVKREPKEDLIKHMNNTFNTAKKAEFNLLLCHTPLAIANKKVLKQLKIHKDLDLIVCGHTHGGITPGFLRPMLKGIGIISPLRKLFFENAYGQKQINNTNIIISSGVTKAGHRNRFYKFNSFFASEITIIDVKKTR